MGFQEPHVLSAVLLETVRDRPRISIAYQLEFRSDSNVIAGDTIDVLSWAIMYNCLECRK